MLSFLMSFSNSFLLAILFWPFLALALTLPVLIAQYRRYNKLLFRRALAIYAMMLYGLALISFTLYPMPDNPAEFCQAYHLLPQLNPLQFISDIGSDGVRAILQLGMNVVFFVPLGVFAHLLFNWRMRTVLLVGLGVSLLIETAQLTGGFGMYPCGYRLFDIDDLILNTMGALVGYGLARLVPHHELKAADHPKAVRKPGPVRHLIAFILDEIISVAIAMFVLLAIYFTIGHDVAMTVRDFVLPIVVVVMFGLMPYLAKGWTLGGVVVRLNYDDKERISWRRLLFYALRTVMVMLLLFPPFGLGAISIVMLLVIVIIWWRWKRLPYQFV